MTDAMDEEAAIAIMLAISERLREPHKENRKNLWKSGDSHRMPASWSMKPGWQSASRHDGTRGRRSPWVVG